MFSSLKMSLIPTEAKGVSRVSKSLMYFTSWYGVYILPPYTPATTGRERERERERKREGEGQGERKSERVAERDSQS